MEKGLVSTFDSFLNVDLRDHRFMTVTRKEGKGWWLGFEICHMFTDSVVFKQYCLIYCLFLQMEGVGDHKIDHFFGRHRCMTLTKRSYDVLALQNRIHSVGVIKLWHVFQIYEHDVVHFLIFYEYSSNQDRILTRKAPTPQNPAFADELFWVYFTILGCWDIKG